MIYHPDKWLVLRFITSKETFYKLFATWYGGYTQGDSWKLNSGIEEVRWNNGKVEFLGYSGSVYSCSFDMQGSSWYGSSVLSGILESTKMGSVRIEIVEFNNTADLLDFDWKE